MIWSHRVAAIKAEDHWHQWEFNLPLGTVSNLTGFSTEKSSTDWSWTCEHTKRLSHSPGQQRSYHGLCWSPWSGPWLGFYVLCVVYGLWDSLILENICSNRVKEDCSQTVFHHNILCYKTELMFHFSSKEVSLGSSLLFLSSPCWATMSIIRHCPAEVICCCCCCCCWAIPFQFYHSLPQIEAATSPQRADFPLQCYRDSRRQRKRRKGK